MKIAHVVNPLVVTNPDSDLNYAQPVTLRTMSDARRAAADDGLSVTQYAVCYPEDAAAVPTNFVRLPFLDRSVLDCVDTPSGGRKLPLLKDILDRLHHAADDADYLIYSNIDIGLWPHFYLRVAEYIQQGYDAFEIGRRTLSQQFTKVEDLPMILAQKGEYHQSLSCFVFPRAQYPRYLLHQACIGLQPIGVTLAVNMNHHARRHKFIDDEQLTFHLGDDRVWSRTLLDPWHVHNERMLDRVVDELGELQSDAKAVLRIYQRWRSDYVVAASSNRLQRNLFRLARKIGLESWVAGCYDNVRRT